MKIFCKLIFLLCAVRLASTETRQYWLEEARGELQRALGITETKGVAKNVMLFLGDGMGLSTVAGGRIYQGQLKNQNGEENLLAFEKFLHVGLAKTYNNDRQVSDSAGTATAFLGGVKANYGTVGLDSTVSRYNCTAQLQESTLVTSILDWSLAKGKSVGFVTTTRVTHATPAASYAHSSDRNWEDNTNAPPECKDIARQLIEDNPNIQVILGGGRRSLLPVSLSGRRTDNRNLIEQWRTEKASRNVRASYVQNKTEFDAIDPSQTDYLLGLFSSSHMSYDIERDPNLQPSLREMTDKAIKILRKNPKGFFLLVEGGRIDHGHHENYAKRALHDVVAFDKALTMGLSLTRKEDTLTVVTADHSHVFNIAGYPKRGNDLFGFVTPIFPGEGPSDNNPYLTLVYGNGPGPGRRNLTGVDTNAVDFQQTNPVNMPWETHSGEDVAIYAQGPWAHLFHGVHEQHYIAHVMAYSSCVGEYNNCPRPQPKADDSCVGSAGKAQSSFVLVVVAVCMKLYTALND